MSLREAVAPKLNKELKEQKRREALQVLEKGVESIHLDLREAYLRLQLRNSLLIPGLMKNYSNDYLAKYVAEIFAPPASPEEAKIQLLADLAIDLMFQDKKIEPIVSEALSEIEEAYNVIISHGGGWSCKSNPEKRKTAVLKWYRLNQAHLSYLKEIYLDDTALYEDGGGAERRNFKTILLKKIIKDIANQELTFQKVDVHLKNLKRIKRHPPLRLEDL
jgi:hypothetical protein